MNNFAKIGQAFRSSGILKLYLLAVLALFGFYCWSALNGNRFTGDSSDSKELHSNGAHGVNHFYHK